MLSLKTEKTYFKIGGHTVRARGRDADRYSVHLKDLVFQPFQHSFGFKGTVLMVKRVEAQSVCFAPSER